MNKMIPVFLVLAVVVLAGLAIAGYSMRKNSGTGTAAIQITNPSGATPAPTVSTNTQENSASGNYQSGITLSVTSPSNGSTLASANVTVTGKTAPNAEVFVNDASGASDTNGNFSIATTLDEGENTIVVSVNDANGNSAEQEVNVSFTSAQ